MKQWWTGPALLRRSSARVRPCAFDLTRPKWSTGSSAHQVVRGQRAGKTDALEPSVFENCGSGPDFGQADSFRCSHDALGDLASVPSLLIIGLGQDLSMRTARSGGRIGVLEHLHVAVVVTAASLSVASVAHQPMAPPRAQDPR